MKTQVKRILLRCVMISVCIALVSGTAACGGRKNPSAVAALPDIPTLADDVAISAEDERTDWDEKTATQIMLNRTDAAITGAGASFSGKNVSITAAGTYVLSGSTGDMSLIVDAAKTDVVRLILSGTDISCSDRPVLFAKTADKLILTVADGTENRLSDGSTHTLIEGETEAPSAVVSAECDMTVNGGGFLSITASSDEGIASQDDLLLLGANIEISSVGDGVRGRDLLYAKNSRITIISGEDGLCSTNEDADKGSVVLSECAVMIESTEDGIQAQSVLEILSGNYDIVTGGGNPGAVSSDGEFRGPGDRDEGTWNGQFPTNDGRMPPNDGQLPADDGRFPGDGSTIPAEGNSITAETGDVSRKALKAGTQLIVRDGAFSIDSAEDGLHSNGSVCVLGGELDLSCYDDGIHAETAANIAAGTIHISDSYEGIEGTSIRITGGDIRVQATDDAVNAAGGTETSETAGRTGRGDMFAVNDENIVEISGGIIRLNSGGDGIDSNGHVYIRGGELYVAGPVSGGNSAIDCNGDFEIHGGTVISVGSAGMVVSPTSGSVQKSIRFEGTVAEGTTLCVTNELGNELISFLSPKNAQSVIVSLPDFKEGETYLLLSGGTHPRVPDEDFSAEKGYAGGEILARFTIRQTVTVVTPEA